ncbi:MAG: alpha/beta hydrolase-fold protein [Marinifilaceae bacterium]|jgi:predicted alpha/beta superfamily hydrolase|nr:alpha/beta hydrolase-fold protein [Marinifilaceae bacterium]
MKKIFVLFLIFYSFNLFAQSLSLEDIPNCNGKNMKELSFYSEALDLQVDLTVLLPNSYNSSNEIVRYPVIYVLDSDNEFDYLSASIERISKNKDVIPEHIIVGIDFSDKFDLLNSATEFIKNQNPKGKLKEFTSYLNDELVDKLDEKFRTSGMNILYGVEFGALLALNVLFTPESKFDCFLCVNPVLTWNNYSVLSKCADFSKTASGLNRYLYLSGSGLNGSGIESLVSQIKIGDYVKGQNGIDQLDIELDYDIYTEFIEGVEETNSILKALNSLYKSYYIDPSLIKKMSDLSLYDSFFRRYFFWSDKTGFTYPFRSFSIVVNNMLTNKSLKLNVSKLEEYLKVKNPASLPDFYNVVGNTLYLLGDTEKGLEVAKTNAESNNNPMYYITLANMYALNKKLVEAEALADKAIEIAKINNCRTWYIKKLISEKKSLKALYVYKVNQEKMASKKKTKPKK